MSKSINETAIHKGLAAAFAAFAIALALMFAAPGAALADDGQVDLGVSLGSGYTVLAQEVPVYQEGIKGLALGRVAYWRKDALNDTSVKWGGVTMREYLAAHGISEDDYLSPAWSNEAERISIQRAVECHVTWAHTRPNDESWDTATYPNGYSTSEVISWASWLPAGYNISEHIDMWASEKADYVKNTGAETGHYEFLIDPENTHYGFSVVNGSGVGRSYVGSTDSSETGLSGVFTMPLNVSNDYMKASGVVVDFKSIAVGETKAAHVFVNSKDLKLMLVGTWTSNDESVATITEGGQLTGVAPGTCRVAISCYDAAGVQGGSNFPVIVGAVDMYRLYNHYSGEHFYTSNASERNNLVSVGWDYEGIGWVAPSTSETPVYRLYNAYGGEHHYTTSLFERDYLVWNGWKYEGIGWYSDDRKSTVLYREYNPNAFANNHNYTTSKSEHDHLLSLGWHDEGYAWYGMSEG